MAMDLELEALPLPAMHFGLSTRAIDKLDDLKSLREHALADRPPEYPTVPQYFWGADDRWFQAVNIRKVRRAPFFKRFTGPDDLMIAEYQLRELPQTPIDLAAYVREQSRSLGMEISDKEKLKTVRKELRECKTSRDFYDWMKRNRIQGGY